MAFYNHTVKKKVILLLNDIENLDKNMLNMLKNIKICRKQCKQTAQTIDGFNQEIEINYKKIGEF